MLRKSAAALIAATAAFALAPVAVAAPEDVTPQFEIVSTHSKWLTRGDSFTIRILRNCPGGPDGAESTAFRQPVAPGESTGQLQDTWGEFTATLKCKGTSTVGRKRFTVLYTEPIQTDRDVYLPGETIKIDAPSSGCADQAGSPGFVEQHVRLRLVTGGRQIGEATAVETPGTYDLSMWCGHQTVSIKFMIVAAQ